MVATANVGQVILLNGTSSAGKSTLAKKLQQLLPSPYQHMALDQYRDGLPDRFRGLNSPAGSPGALGLNVVPALHNGEQVTRVEFGAHGERVLQGMRRSVAALAKHGLNVIVDDLLFKADYLLDYAQILDPYRTWCVGVHCEAWRVSEREALRPGRFPGTAEAHLHELHSHGLTYDVEVDTTYASADECAAQIISGMASTPTGLNAWYQQQPAQGSG